MKSCKIRLVHVLLIFCIIVGIIQIYQQSNETAKQHDDYDNTLQGSQLKLHSSKTFSDYHQSSIDYPQKVQLSLILSISSNSTQKKIELITSKKKLQAEDGNENLQNDESIDLNSKQVISNKVDNRHFIHGNNHEINQEYQKENQKEIINSGSTTGITSNLQQVLLPKTPIIAGPTVPILNTIAMHNSQLNHNPNDVNPHIFYKQVSNHLLQGDNVNGGKNVSDVSLSLKNNLNSEFQKNQTAINFLNDQLVTIFASKSSSEMNGSALVTIVFPISEKNLTGDGKNQSIAKHTRGSKPKISIKNSTKNVNEDLTDTYLKEKNDMKSINFEAEKKIGQSLFLSKNVSVLYLHVFRSGGATFCFTAKQSRQRVPGAKGGSSSCNLVRGINNFPIDKQLSMMKNYDVVSNEYDGLPVSDDQMISPKDVVWITTLRNPLNRFLSHFFLAQSASRRGNGIFNQLLPLPIPEKNIEKRFHDLTFEEFLLWLKARSNDPNYPPENLNLHWTKGDFILRYFVGFDACEPGKCTNEHLQKAKARLLNYFSSVMILENYNRDFQVLEKLLGWPKKVYVTGVNRNSNAANELRDSKPLLQLLQQFVGERDLELYKFAVKLSDQKAKALLH